MDHSSLLQHALESAQPYLNEYGYIAIFVAVTVEGFGIPAPGQTLMEAGAVLAARGQMNLAGVLFTAWVAAVIGDNIGYAIGHFGGRRLVLHHGRHFGVREDHLRKVERFFDRYGGGIVAVARFFEVLRQLNGVIAGTSGMHWWRFLFYNALGAALWVGVWGAGAYYLGRKLEAVVDFFQRYEPYVITAGVAGAVVLLVYLFWRRRV